MVVGGEVLWLPVYGGWGKLLLMADGFLLLMAKGGADGFRRQERC